MCKINRFLLVALALSLFISCNNISKNEKDKDNELDFPSQTLEYAEIQLSRLRNDAVFQSRLPRTVENNKIHWTDEYDYIDWTEGFFPGTCWYMYEFTDNTKWRNAAEQLQSLFEDDKLLKRSHDLGFIFNSSYGNGYRITKNEKYKDVLIEAAKSLSTRFNPKVGLIQSWDVVDGNWQSFRGWEYPVIIDNMMNLELLFNAFEITADSSFYKIAVSHADKTLKNHFREDNSCYHVVDYSTTTGEVRSKQTAQGYSDDSDWVRGQAWALYGYTMCYRFTKDKRYTDQAEKVVRFILNHSETPADLIPYWDYDAPNKETQPRDASAAAVIASALIELSQYSDINYTENATQILRSLASPEYMARIGTNHNFLLMHSTGSIPHKSEIDAPLNYADYYFVEALLRLKEIEGK